MTADHGVEPNEVGEREPATRRGRVTHTFVAPGGTVFRYNAGYSGDAHIAPAISDSPVEVPIDDLVAFVGHVVTQRQSELAGN